MQNTSEKYFTNLFSNKPINRITLKLQNSFEIFEKRSQSLVKKMNSNYRPLKHSLLNYYDEGPYFIHKLCQTKSKIQGLSKEIKNSRKKTEKREIPEIKSKTEATKEFPKKDSKMLKTGILKKTCPYFNTTANNYSIVLQVSRQKLRSFTPCQEKSKIKLKHQLLQLEKYTPQLTMQSEKYTPQLTKVFIVKKKQKFCDKETGELEGWNTESFINY